MRTLFHLRATLLAFCFCLISSPLLAADLWKADALLTAGKPAEAYALLLASEMEDAGDPVFDYFLALSALDSGHPDKATLVFERVLAVDPTHAAARMNICRAYYLMGDLVRAGQECEAVLTQPLPEAARISVMQYVDAIKAAERAKLTSVTGYLEVGAGYDSNVNSATKLTQLPLPAFGNYVVDLDPRSSRVRDNYLGVVGGAELTHQVEPGLSVYAGADLRQRNNETNRIFNTTSFDGRAGLSHVVGDNTFRLGVLGGKYYLDNRDTRDSAGVNADWRRVVDNRNQFTVFVQGVRYRYVEESQKSSNFDLTTSGFGWMHSLSDAQAVIFGSLYHGEEQETDSRADGSKRFYGAKIGGQTTLAQKLALFASFGAQQGSYGRDNAVFLERRGDRMYDATIGLNWQLDGAWLLRPQVAYVRNKSNISIYDYDRADLSVSLRYSFR